MNKRSMYLMIVLILLAGLVAACGSVSSDGIPTPKWAASWIQAQSISEIQHGSVSTGDITLIKCHIGRLLPNGSVRVISGDIKFFRIDTGAPVSELEVVPNQGWFVFYAPNGGIIHVEASPLTLDETNYDVVIE